MRLVLFRHGIAFDRADPLCPPDPARPLTEQGIARTRQAARGLKRLGVVPDLLISSPYLRAIETARILAEVYGIHAGSIHETRDLEPCVDPAAILPRLEQLGATCAFFVGHSPHLDLLLALLVGAPGHYRLRLGKAGAACLEIDEEWPEEGRLLWLLRPRQLRQLAGRGDDEK